MRQGVVYDRVEDGIGWGKRYFVDLDGDGEKELVLTMDLSGNSVPREEFVVLKRVGDGWKELETCKSFHEYDVAKTKEETEICGIMNGGILEIHLTELEGRPCLIALQGVKGYSEEDDWGEVEVYFDYDANGKIRILNLKLAY